MLLGQNGNGQKGDFKLRQSWLYPDVYKIVLDNEESEYLLIENRQPGISPCVGGIDCSEQGSFDTLISLGGLAIWHVDETMYLSGNSVEGYPGQSGWPANGKHYHVALLQADGRYDLEQGYNRGDYSDFFRFDHYFGVDYLFPSLDPITGPFPNTDAYKWGAISQTNHFISGISGTIEIRLDSVLCSLSCSPYLSINMQLQDKRWHFPFFRHPLVIPMRFILSLPS